MEDNWIKVFENREMIRAEIVRELLEQHSIPAVIVNKKDSLYPMFGVCQVHVPAKDETLALNVISDEGTLTDPQ